jgi:prepilin-type processing-associated H-X9-DG protein
MLLPALNRAREAANNVKCLSNLRQMASATLLFANDHKGYVPTSSDDWFAKQNDPSFTKFSYRSVGGINYVKDWASSLIKYFGGGDDDTFLTNTEKSGVFKCPSDRWQNEQQPGYRIFNNVIGTYQPVSYAPNIDITTMVDTGVYISYTDINASGYGRFGGGSGGASDVVGVFGGPTGGPTNNWAGQPLGCKIGKVRRPFEVLMYADGGTRPNQYPSGTAPLDNTEVLAYTTNFNSSGPTLYDIWITPWLGSRIPFERHGGKRQGGSWQNAKINVVFCDGHAETVLLGNMRAVRVSPW